MVRWLHRQGISAVWTGVAAVVAGASSSVGAQVVNQDRDDAIQAAVAVSEVEVPTIPGDQPVVPTVASGAMPESTTTIAGQPLYVPVPVEDSTGGRALGAFYRALDRAASGLGKARILFYGASHVASDIYTDRVRAELQRRFGDGGAGFVMPAKPWKYYRHARVEHVESQGWRSSWIRARAPLPDRYGLGGVTLVARSSNAFARFRTRGDSELPGYASQFEVIYLRQPDGGRVQVILDGHEVGIIQTAAEDPEPGYFQFTADDGHHELELRTLDDGIVTVYGMTLERDQAGVVLDTAGIPGARARNQLFWEDNLYREHILHRAPDLVVMAYGTNEAGDKAVPIADYERELNRTLSRLKTAAPGVSCLLIGPSDRPERRRDGSYVARERTDQIVDVQRRTAALHGCAFFDAVAFMGGSTSMVTWAAASPPLGAPDHVHYTRRGYELFGDHLAAALLAGHVPEAAAGAPTAASMR